MGDHKQRRARSGVLVASGIVALSLAGIATYNWWFSKNSDPEPVEHSQCIVVGPEMVSRGLQDLESVLQKNVVLLIVPGTEIEQSESHKVIKCDTMQGLWACIRHLRKHTLVYSPIDVPSGPPGDIQRYVERIVTI